MVTSWRQHVRELLEAGGIKQSELAQRAELHKSSRTARVYLNRYLSGNRVPPSDVLRQIDRNLEKLLGRRGVAMSLDLAALGEGILEIDSDIDIAIAGMLAAALEDLDDRKMLVRDWKDRFTRYIEARIEDDEGLRKMINAVCVATRISLIDDIVGRTPVKSTTARVCKALSDHGLGDLCLKTPDTTAAVDSFKTAVRNELIHPPDSTRERLDAEDRMLRSAWEFAANVFGSGELRRILKGKRT